MQDWRGKCVTMLSVLVDASLIESHGCFAGCCSCLVAFFAQRVVFAADASMGHEKWET